MEDFTARVIAAHQAGLAERRAMEQMQREAEDHDLNVKARRIALDQAKLDQALHERQIQAMQSGGETGQATVQAAPTYTPQPSAPDTITAPEMSPQLPKTMADLLTQIRQQPVAAQPMP